MRLFLAALAFCACTDELVCGPGTVKSGTLCVTSTPIVPCGDGGVIVGGNCYPDPTLLCGPDTVWDPMLQRCKGTGGGGECVCSTPNDQVVCISGQVSSFVSPSVSANDTTGLKVRAYNPIQFITNPNSLPLGESTVKASGCFVIDGLPRSALGQGLVAVSVTDAGSATGGTFAVTGVGSPIVAGRNVTDLQAYYIERTTVDTWASQATDPTLLSDGFWIGLFVDAAGHPVSGVTPSRPGQEPAPGEIYCFRGDRMTLSTEDTTDATGLCGISPDIVVPHTGKCGGAPCNPPFQQLTGGTTSNVVFIEPIPQM